MEQSRGPLIYALLKCDFLILYPVNREDITQGASELGVDLDEHIRFVIDALRPIQEQLGLNKLHKG